MAILLNLVKKNTCIYILNYSAARVAGTCKSFVVIILSMFFCKRDDGLLVYTIHNRPT